MARYRTYKNGITGHRYNGYYIIKGETKGTFATIILKSLNEIEVFIPCLEEQQKIADFLSAYDEAISYAKQELEHWKQLKKGLLQQMFV